MVAGLRAKGVAFLTLEMDGITLNGVAGVSAAGDPSTKMVG